MSAHGYSGTPLARKLGIAAGQRVALLDAPADYFDWLAPMPPAVDFVAWPDATAGLVHAFLSERERLADWLRAERDAMPASRVLWVSWPKKASRVPTSISEDLIREFALPLGLVDVKVCAVSAVWSGLKLVLRKSLR